MCAMVNITALSVFTNCIIYSSRATYYRNITVDYKPAIIWTFKFPYDNLAYLWYKDTLEKMGCSPIFIFDLLQDFIKKSYSVSESLC